MEGRVTETPEIRRQEYEWFIVSISMKSELGEIIRLKSVLVESKTGEYKFEFSELVKPKIFGLLSKELDSLGIKSEEINSAPLLEDVLKKYGNWLREKKVVLSRCAFVAWDNEFEDLLRKQCKQDGESIPVLRTCISLRKAFCHSFKRSPSPLNDGFPFLFDNDPTELAKVMNQILRRGYIFTDFVNDLPDNFLTSSECPKYDAFVRLKRKKEEEEERNESILYYHIFRPSSLYLPQKDKLDLYVRLTNQDEHFSKEILKMNEGNVSEAAEFFLKSECERYVDGMEIENKEFFRNIRKENHDWKDALYQAFDERKLLLVALLDSKNPKSYIQQEVCWKCPLVHFFLQRYFIFYEEVKQFGEPHRFSGHYYDGEDSITYPLIAVVDPRDGRMKRDWGGIILPLDLLESLNEFLSDLKIGVTNNEDPEDEGEEEEEEIKTERSNDDFLMNKDFVRNLLKKNGYWLEFLPDRLRSDPEMIELAVTTNIGAIWKAGKIRKFRKCMLDIARKIFSEY